MNVASKRGAALAIVIVVSAAIMILSAALVSTAVYNTDSAQNSLEGRQAYLDVKSVIEYGKAYVNKNPDCGDFTIVADDSAGSSGYKIGTGGTPLATYTKANRTIAAKVKYQFSNRYRKLKYTFPPLVGGVPAYIDAGKQHGKITLFNGDYVLNGTAVDSPIVAKGIVKLNSTITPSFQADQMYFMGLVSDDADKKCLQINAVDAAIILKTDFIYFNSDIRAVSGYKQGLKLEPKNNTIGIAYFNHVKIKAGNVNIVKSSVGSDSELNGYYSFSGTIDLFKDYKSLKKLTEQEVIDELDGQPFTGEKLTASKVYVENNYVKMESGDQDGVKWTGEGNVRDISEGQYSQLGKSVYMYITDIQDWNNGSSTKNYKADEIHVQFVNDSKDFEFPKNKTVIFMADQISLNTQIADDNVGEDDPSKPMIYNTNGTSHCILKSKDGNHEFDLIFHFKTTVCYADGETYVIKPGTYHITESIGYNGSGIGIDLFTTAAKDYFEHTRPDSAGGPGDSGGSGGSGGTGGTGGLLGGYSDE